MQIPCNVQLRYSSLLKWNRKQEQSPTKCFKVTSQPDRRVQIHDTTKNGHKLSASIRGSKFFTALATICASRRSSIGQILHKSGLQRNTIRTLQYAYYFANKTRSSYSDNFWGSHCNSLNHPALTVKSVPQRTGLLAPRTNLQPKCISALDILGCSESAFLALPYKVFTLYLANRNFCLDISLAVRRHDSKTLMFIVHH